MTCNQPTLLYPALPLPALLLYALLNALGICCYAITIIENATKLTDQADIIEIR